jgi:glutathione S-transferase
MSLHLYLHPLASFCWKALTAFYENDTAFEPHIVDLGNETSRADFKKSGPSASFRCCVTGEGSNDSRSSIIIECLSQHYPGKTQLVPTDADLARETRSCDRF